jgi:2-aminoadipate transaminase
MTNTIGLPQGVSQQTISLRLGHPDPATLATTDFQEAVRRVMASPQARQTLAYGNEQGDLDLIDYLTKLINQEQRLSLQAGNIAITAGSTGAVDMITRLYTHPGDAVIVEAPTYVDTLHVFRDHDVVLYSVPMDDEGMQPDALERLLTRLSAEGRRLGLLYTIPNFHNPTGITTSEARRRQIVEIARRYELLIVEDDVYRDLVFEGTIPPSYLALAGEDHAMQIGSVSKTIAPGLRVGWIATSAERVQDFVNCGTSLMGGGANPLAAQIVAEFGRSGSWSRHLASICSLYQSRRDTLLAALKQFMPDSVRWTQPEGGYFVWLTLPEGCDGTIIKARANERGVLVSAGEGFFVNPDEGKRYLRLTYSFASLPDIEMGVRILGDVIREG